MTYQQTLDYLFTTLPMFSRIGPAAIKKDLTNTLRLCSHLNNPQNRFKSVHIAGTNGKGSVSHMLAAVLQTAGYKTGLYTSPHLKDFRERIRINGEMIREAFVVDFVERLQPLIEEIQPSFFEITVGMAFDFFAKEKVDISVIEVGLGGRLDSTNIIQPELSVITNIGMDHTNMLGNTLQKIAVEKGGIIKEGVPVVIGEKHIETEQVFTKLAVNKNAPIYFANDIYSAEQYQLHNNSITISVKKAAENSIYNYQLDLAGIYQTKNILTLLQSVQVLNEKGWQLTGDVIIKALRNIKGLTGLHGRWEVIHSNPTVVLEVAHNEDGIRQMLAHIEQLSYNNLHIIFGMVKDKEAEKIVTLLPQNAIYYFTAAPIPRALPAKELQTVADAFHLKSTIYTDVNAALQQALAAAVPDDLILVCGSIFLVAEVDLQKVRNLH